MDAGLVVIIVVVVVAVIGLIIFSQSVFIVKQAEGVVIERLGKFHRVLGSGFNTVVPFIDAARPFTWRKTYIDPNGVVQSEDITQVRIDMRESVFNFMRQEVYTQDTVLLDVNALMYYRITDIKKAIYEVDDLQAAISNVAQTQIKEVFGNMSFAEALGAQHQINHYMKTAFGERFATWGVQVERLELLDMTPKAGTTISDAMKRQMIAERDRRADFIRAEGKKTAMKLQADGAKLEKYNLGLAEQESTRKLSEGDAGAKVELARAESASLEMISSAIAKDNVSQTSYMMAQRYMELFRNLVDTVDRKVIYLPYAASGMSGVIGQLPAAFGMLRKKGGSSSGRPFGYESKRDADRANYFSADGPQRPPTSQDKGSAAAKAGGTDYEDLN